MIEYYIQLSWLILSNLLSAIIIFASVKRLEKSPLRTVFIFLIIASLLYINPLIYFWSPQHSLETRLLLSRLVFNGILIFANVFSLFIIIFCDLKEEFRHYRFYLFQFINIGLLISNAMGFMILDVIIKDGEVFLVRGVAYKGFVIGAIFFFFYYGFLCLKGYSLSQSNLFRHQMRMILGTGLVTAFALVITNVLVPFLTGSSNYAPVGALNIMIFYLGIFYVLINGEKSLLKRSFNKLMRHPYLRTLENKLALSRVFHFVQMATENNQAFFQRVEFSDPLNPQKISPLYLSNAEFKKTIDKRRSISPAWYLGLLEAFQGLQRDVINLISKQRRSSETIYGTIPQTIDRLPLLLNAEQLYRNTKQVKKLDYETIRKFIDEDALQQLLESKILNQDKSGNFNFDKESLIDEMLSDNEPERVVKSLPIVSNKKQHILFDEVISELRLEIDNFEAAYGVPLLFDSPKSNQLLSKVDAVENVSATPVFFAGETGTGKSSLARSLHFFRTQEILVEISCQSNTSAQISDHVDAFLSTDTTGILIKHLDSLVDDGIMALQPLLNGISRNKYVYFTGSEAFLKRQVSFAENIFYGLKQLVINTIPLRLNQVEIAKHFLWQSFQASTIQRKDFVGISHQFLKHLLRYEWPGNLRELIGFANEIVLNHELPFIEDLSKIPQTYSESYPQETNLSPLEYGERDIIIEYLKKNKFNKNRTRKDLNITINTLNSKIEKYEINVPEKGEA